MDTRERVLWDKYFIQYIILVRGCPETAVTAQLDPSSIIRLNHLAKECFFNLVSTCDLSSYDAFTESVKELVGDRSFEEIEEVLKTPKGHNGKPKGESHRKKSLSDAKGMPVHVFPTVQIWHRLCVVFGETLDQLAVNALLLILQYVLATTLGMAADVAHRSDTVTERDVQIASDGFSLLSKVRRKACPKDKVVSDKLISYVETAEQFLQAEKKLVRDLDIVIQVFFNKLDPSIAPSSPFLPEEISALFDSFQRVHETASAFTILFESKVEQRVVHLGESFAEFALYHEYDGYMTHMHNFKSVLDTIALLSARDTHVAYLKKLGLFCSFKYILPVLMFEPVNVVLNYSAVIKLLLKAQQSKAKKTAGDVQDAASLRTALTLISPQVAQASEYALQLRTTHFEPFSTIVPPLGLNMPQKQKALQRQIIKQRLGGVLDVSTAEVVADSKQLLWGDAVDICSVNGVSEGKLKRGKPRACMVYSLDTGVVVVKGTDESEAKASVLHLISNDSVMIYRGDERVVSERFVIYMIQIINKGGIALVCDDETTCSNWMSHLTYAKQFPSLFRLLTEDRVGRGLGGATAMRIPEEMYRFATVDTPNNMRYEHDSTTVVIPWPTVKGGAVFKLIERLTYPLYFDIKYIQQFLLTYRAFMKPTQLLHLLVERYDVPDPPYLTSLQCLQFARTVRNPIQTRVVNVLRLWVDNHFDDLIEYADAPEELMLFLERAEKDTHATKSIQATMRVVDQKRAVHTDSDIIGPAKREKRNSVVFGVAAPDIDVSNRMPQRPDNYDILNISTLEIARQMTLIDFDLFAKIKSTELVNQAWNKNGAKAPNICANIDRFNLVSQWVTTTIIETLNLEERTEVLCAFVEVAHHFLEMNNLNGLMQIISGIEATSVFRLKATFKAMDKRHQQLFSECKTVTSTANNSSVIRTLVLNATPSCIPFVGLYLQDLTFIEEGNAVTLASLDDNDKDGKIINFVRCRRVAQVVTDLLQHQQSPYNLRLCGDVREYVLYLKAGVPDELYAQSLLLEPRNSGTLDAEGNLIRAPTNSDASRSHTICRAHYLHRVAAIKAEAESSNLVVIRRQVPRPQSMGSIASPTPIHPLRLSQSNRERSGRPAYKSMSESIQEAPPPQRPPRRCSAAPDSYSASNPRATTRATVGVIRKQRTSSPMTSKRMTHLVLHLSEPEVAPARPPRRSALPPSPSLPSA